MKNGILITVLIVAVLVLGFLYMKEKTKPQTVNNDFDFTNQTEESPIRNNPPTNNYPVYTPPVESVPPQQRQQIHRLQRLRRLQQLLVMAQIVYRVTNLQLL